MTVNLGTTDRFIRIIVGLVLLIAPLANLPAIWSSGTWATLSMAVGLVLIATGFFRFCPLYRVLGISTCKV